MGIGRRVVGNENRGGSFLTCRPLLVLSVMPLEKSPFGFQRIKVIALAVTDIKRAERFYAETLALPPALEGKDQVGYLLGTTIIMLKENWYAAPTPAPNPRVTIATDDARETEQALARKDVVISDKVQLYDEFY